MFLAQDTPGGRAPHDDFWYMPVGTESAAGVRVSPATALALSAVYACALVLGQSVGVVPVHLYRRLDNGGKDRATEHPLHRLLHRQPNRWQTSYQFRQMLQWHLALRYNAYAEKRFDRRGAVVELVPRHPDRVTVERFAGSDGVPDFRYRVKDDAGRERVLVRDEMFHLRGLTSDGIEGFSPLDVQRDSIGEALAAQNYSARRMKNDARPGGILEWAGHFNTDDDKRKFRASWQEAQTQGNSGKTALLERGMTWKEIGVKNTDLQYIELRKLKNYDIAAIHRMPPHKIGIMEKATFTNIEHQGIEFITDTMMPWFVNWEQELSLQLLDDGEADELFFEHLVQSLLRGDSGARAAYYSKGILDGWLTRNEARIAENMNPLDNLDEPLAPLNMRGASEDPAATDPEPKPAAAPEDDATASTRLHTLTSAAAARVARKEVEMVRRAHQGASSTPVALALAGAYSKHADFVAAVMAVSPEAAAAYCHTQLAYAQGASHELLSDFETVAQTRLERLALTAA